MKPKAYLTLIALGLVFHGFWLAFGGLTPLPVKMFRTLTAKSSALTAASPSKAMEDKRSTTRYEARYKTLANRARRSCSYRQAERRGFPPPPPAPDQQVLDVVSVLPAFPSCSARGHNQHTRNLCLPVHLKKYAKANLRYPRQAKRRGVEGTVHVNFIVERDGRLSQVRATNRLGYGCEQAAVDLFRRMDRQGLRWAPARSNGKAVRARITLPVTFAMERDGQ